MVADYQKWDAAGEFENPDTQTFMVLPLLYRNLVNVGYPSERLKRLHGVYRQSWYRNRLIMRNGRDVIRLLADDGIPVVILKGAALATDLYYGDTGVRSISDVDMLVPHELGARAVALVMSHGWESDASMPVEYFLRNYHAANLTAGPTASVDVHWDLLVNGHDPKADAELWSRLRTSTLDETEVSVFEPTDQLVHTVAHGGQGELRWIADVVTITRSADGIDWDRFVRDITTRRRITQARANLAAVEYVMPGTVPPWVVDTLAKAPRSLADRVIVHPEGGTTRAESLRNMLVLSLQRTRNRPWKSRAVATRDAVLETTRTDSIIEAGRAVAGAVLKGTPSSRRKP